MVIRDYITKTGKSVYLISKESRIPYTTLNELVNGKKDPRDCSMRTMDRLARYLGLAMEDLCMENVKESRKKSARVATTWEDARLKRYAFPIVQPCDGFDIRRVHPLAQKAAVNIYRTAVADERIRAAILFGSAVNIRCNTESDLDIMVDLQPGWQTTEVRNDVSERIQQSCNWNADILWRDRIPEDSMLLKNIERGVRLV